ncbi:hypothetical protein SOCE26_001270 [Sorangium cellulosum]|uniref:PEGA domain-containing protein n=1 Tax=Sorangium cellulosum TaxID=56 RepID=A0A2L0EHJ5_SORCE|nr:hypothetical protein [Sorangium cellulosum]AUX38749.1 hypothetical protein SOCE26_001270 [Sorangium cellulosum]
MRVYSPGYLLSGLLSVAIAAPASAQPDAVAMAESHFVRGRADMLAGRYQTGCPALAESHRLDPRPGRLFTLAECEARRGRIATAIARYNDYLALYSRMSKAERIKQHERYRLSLEQRDALAPLVPHVTLSLPSGAPAGTVVRHDGITLERPSLGVALPVDPGEHVVTTQAPRGPVHEVKFTIEASESRTIHLEVKPPVEEPPPVRSQGPSVKQGVVPPGDRVAGPAPAPPAAGPGGRRAVTYVTGGLAVSGLVLGSVTGWMALSESSRAATECSNIGPDVAECSPLGKAAGDRAKHLGLMSTIGFGAGGVLAGAAVLLLLTEPRPPLPHAGAVSWSLLAGPTGAGLTVRSRW